MTLLENPSFIDSYDSALEFLESTYAKRNLVHISAKSSIPLLKNQIWLVVRGAVVLSAMNKDNKVAVLGFVGPGQSFGEPLTRIDGCNAVALCDCDVLCLSMDEAYNSGSISQVIFQSIVARNNYAESFLVVLGIKNTKEKVKAFLEMLALDFGHVVEGGIVIGFKINHEQIANALGVTRVTMTRMLNDLKDNGWLKKTKNGHILISNQPVTR